MRGETNARIDAYLKAKEEASDDWDLEVEEIAELETKGQSAKIFSKRLGRHTELHECLRCPRLAKERGITDGLVLESFIHDSVVKSFSPPPVSFI